MLFAILADSFRLTLLGWCVQSSFVFTEILSDPSYPGQWRISGEYIENIARMTHWEYPEAIARFGRQLEALGIAKELQLRGAMDGDLVMVDEYDFEFNPGLTNPYIPQELLEKDSEYEQQQQMRLSEETSCACSD